MDAAQGWSIIGLVGVTLAGLLGLFWTLGRDMRDQARELASVPAGVGTVAATVSTLAERSDERFDRIDERFDRIDERFDRIDERFDRINGTVAALGSLESVATLTEGHGRRFDDLEARLRDQGRELSDGIFEIAARLSEHLRKHAS